MKIQVEHAILSHDAPEAVVDAAKEQLIQSLVRKGAEQSEVHARSEPIEIDLGDGRVTWKTVVYAEAKIGSTDA